MPTPRTVYTVGHSNRPLAALLELLAEHAIQTVVDVRSRPYSRWPQYNQPALQAPLEAAGIAYRWLGRELGGYRPGMDYEQYAQTDEFAAGVRTLEDLAGRSRVAVLCAEARPDRCHRQHIARALEARGWRAIHIIAPGEVWHNPGGPEPHLPL